MKTSALLLLLAAAAARAEFSVPGFELVYTRPVETALEQPELRGPVEVWSEMFASAKSTIDIEEFYFTPKEGEPAHRVFEELKKAGERGVAIRVLAEKKFEKNSAEGFAFLRSIPGLELRVIDWSAVQKDGIVHAKFFVVDGAAAYVGSQNFDWRSLTHIHELGLKVAEPRLVRQIAAVFEHDWKAQARAAAGRRVKPLHKAPPAAQASERAYLVASPFAFNPPGVGDSQSELVRLIGSARDALDIQLLDYAPITRSRRFYAPIDNALRDASLRGVKVRLLVSHWNAEEPALSHLKSLSLLPGVEVRVATLPQAAAGYIPFSRVVHSKYMVLDGKALWLGTSNWSGGYLDNSRNLELVVNDPALAAKALSVHRQLWDSPYSEPLDLAKTYPKPKR